MVEMVVEMVVEMEVEVEVPAVLVVKEAVEVVGYLRDQQSCFLR